MITNEELLPCPFCGAAFKIGQEPHDNHPIAGKYYIYHEYGPIGSAARKCHLEVSGHFESAEDAVTWWNRRSPEAATRLRAGEGVRVDDLAQIIRQVDGNNSLGAGALAEAILSALTAEPRATPQADEVTEAMVERAAEVIFNDIYGARAGAWDNPPVDSIAGIQMRATARAALLAAMQAKSQPTTGQHRFYETGDADAPDIIKDRNGEVVLGLCRDCGRGEIELSAPCTGPAEEVNHG